MLRTLVEKLSRHFVFKRNLPMKFGGGRIFASPDASLRYWKSDLTRVDPFLFKMVDELINPGNIVWDIGANLGLFTFASANRAGPRGKVIAVEPDPWLADLLKRSCGLKDRRLDASVTVIQKAASDKAGFAKLHIAARSRSANHLESGGSTQAGGSRDTEPVSTITLDSLLQENAPPNILKIDVEGFEHRVLAGAKSVLAQAQPVIWCEVDPVNRDVVTEILQAQDYELFYANRQPSQRQPLAKAPWETLACPRAIARRFVS
jgi:FkbM family methyltransferase